MAQLFGIFIFSCTSTNFVLTGLSIVKAASATSLLDVISLLREDDESLPYVNDYFASN